MKMKIYSFENEIVCNSERITVLEIHEQGLFMNLVNNINQLIQGEESTENIILIDEDKQVDWSKDAIMIIDFLNIDYNSRTILSKLYKQIENTYGLEDELRQEFNRIVAKLKNNIDEILEEYPFEFHFKDGIGIQEYLKLLGVKIQSDYYITPIEKIFGMLDLIEVFGLYKLAIFVNLKSFFNQESLMEIYTYAQHKKIPLLVIENKRSKQIIKDEKKIVLDREFDEFVV